MILSLARDLYFLARETVGAISEGVALGLKVIRDESPGVDQITHGPAWRTYERKGPFIPDPNGITGEGLLAVMNLMTSSTDGAVTDPVVESGPAAAASATDAAAGHPNRNDRRVLQAASFGLREWMAGETFGAPTYWASIIHDLDELSK